MGFLVQVLVSAVLLFMLGRLVSGIEVRDGKAAVFGALGLGMANWLVRPLLAWLSWPITIITFGLFGFVINALMLMLAASFVDGFEVEDFSSALWGALALSAMNFVLGMFLGL